MAERVFLHVGTMKSGTSFIQTRLFENQAALKEQAILLPGTVPGKNRAAWNQQVFAVGDVLERQKMPRAKREGAWGRLVEEVAAWPGTAVVSMEFLGPTGPEKVARVVGSFPAAEVHAVVTARDLNRTIPAMWQEALKNSRTWSWEEYLHGVRRGKGPGEGFWREQDLRRIARNWSEAVGKERFALVTLPPPGADPEVLWDRFSSVVGIAPGSCAPVPPANESLGAASALVLRELNAVLEEAGVPWSEYAFHVKHKLAKTVLAGHRRQEEPIGLAVPRWVRRRSAKMVGELERMGLRVVGDLAELAPVDVKGVDPRTVSERDQLAAAVAGLAGLIEEQRRRSASDE